jgi:hypothetical protein
MEGAARAADTSSARLVNGGAESFALARGHASALAGVTADEKGKLLIDD